MMTAKTSPNYKVNILDAVFKAFKVKVDSAIFLNHTETIIKTPARYNYVKSAVKNEHHSKYYWEDVWNG